MLADEITSSNPAVAKVICKDFCMDDLITGCDSVIETVAFSRCIRSTISAKFSLRKYVSNSIEFLKSVHHNLVEHNTSKSIEIEIVKLLEILRLFKMTN